MGIPDSSEPAADHYGNASPPIISIDAVQRDIALANNYRIELIKYLLGISAALFAFTLTFRPSLHAIAMPWAMWLGWLGLGVSMIGGMIHMIGWDHYYKSYRDYDYKGLKSDGVAARRFVNVWRRLGMTAQFAGFAFGVAGIGIFAAMNLDNIRQPTPDRPATAATCIEAAKPASSTSAARP